VWIRPAVAATRHLMIKVEHILESTILCVEEFGAPFAVNTGIADGSDAMTVMGGYPIIPKGDRVRILVASFAAASTCDFAVKWGSAIPSRVTQVGGFFDYDSTGGEIAAGTVFARVGILRPMKSAVLNARFETGSAAFTIGISAVRAVRQNIAPGGPTITSGALATTDVRFVLAGYGADTTFDQEAGFDWYELFNNVAVVIGGTGRAHWRLTTSHV